MKYNFKKLMFAQLVSLAFIVMQSSLIYADDPVIKNSKKKTDEAKQKELFLMTVSAFALVGAGGAVAFTIFNNKKHAAGIKKLEDQDKAFHSTAQGVMTSHKQLAERVAAGDFAVQQRNEAVDGKLAGTQRSINALKKKVKDMNEVVSDAQTVADIASEQVEAMRQSFTLEEPLPILDLHRARGRQLAMACQARAMIEGGHPHHPIGNIYAAVGPHQTVFERSNNLITVLRNQAQAQAAGGFQLGFAPIVADNPLILQPAPLAPAAAHH